MQKDNSRLTPKEDTKPSAMDGNDALNSERSDESVGDIDQTNRDSKTRDISQNDRVGSPGQLKKPIEKMSDMEQEADHGQEEMKNYSAQKRKETIVNLSVSSHGIARGSRQHMIDEKEMEEEPGEEEETFEISTSMINRQEQNKGDNSIPVPSKHNERSNFAAPSMQSLPGPLSSGAETLSSLEEGVLTRSRKQEAKQVTENKQSESSGRDPANDDGCNAISQQAIDTPPCPEAQRLQNDRCTERDNANSTQIVTSTPGAHRVYPRGREESHGSGFFSYRGSDEERNHTPVEEIPTLVANIVMEPIAVVAEPMTDPMAGPESQQKEETTCCTLVGIKVSCHSKLSRKIWQTGLSIITVILAAVLLARFLKSSSSPNPPPKPSGNQNFTSANSTMPSSAPSRKLQEKPSSSISRMPSASPSSIQTNFTTRPNSSTFFAPSQMPSASLSSIPTNEAEQAFLQTYEGKVLKRMNEEQIGYFQKALASYTWLYGENGGEGEAGRVTTKCKLVQQTVSIGAKTNVLEVDFMMTYTSPITNVTELDYPGDFYDFVNSETGKSRTLFNLQSVRIAVEEINDVQIKVEAPTTSPTHAPTTTSRDPDPRPITQRPVKPPLPTQRPVRPGPPNEKHPITSSAPTSSAMIITSFPTTQLITSYAPSVLSTQPTSSPTYFESQVALQRYLQTYKGNDLEQMTPEQVIYFQNTFASYTWLYGRNGGEGEPGRVTTKCELVQQTVSVGANTNVLEVDFMMTYTSPKTNVTELDYPGDFSKFMNSEMGKSRALINLQSVGIAMEEINVVQTKIEAPTTSPIHVPTAQPFM